MRKIAISKGKETIIDDEKYDDVSGHRWRFIDGKHRNGKGYAATTIDGKTVYLHQFVFGGKAETIDHINGDALDNRLSNLRPASQRQQTMNRLISKNNTTGFKGVIKARNGKYRAAISHKHLGSFSDKEEAAKAYNKAALEQYGEFAKLNNF